jgi:hypothetical protein
LFLLTVQTAGALFFISRELPDFRQLALYPGEQLALSPDVPQALLARADEVIE